MARVPPSVPARHRGFVLTGVLLVSCAGTDPLPAEPAEPAAAGAAASPRFEAEARPGAALARRGRPAVTMGRSPGAPTPAGGFGIHSVVVVIAAPLRVRLLLSLAMLGAGCFHSFAPEVIPTPDAAAGSGPDAA